jgi:hypothetical protein
LLAILVLEIRKLSQCLKKITMVNWLDFNIWLVLR